MELQQAGDDAVVFGGVLVDLFEQVETVDAVDHRHVRGDVFDFVGLKVADEVPFDVLREDFVFGFHLLGVVLTKNALSMLVQRGNVLRRFEFGDGDQAHTGG